MPPSRCRALGCKGGLGKPVQKDAELTRLDLPTVHIFGLKQIKVCSGCIAG